MRIKMSHVASQQGAQICDWREQSVSVVQREHMVDVLLKKTPQKKHVSIQIGLPGHSLITSLKNCGNGLFSDSCLHCMWRILQH